MKNIKEGKKKITNLASVSLCLCAILFFFSCPDSLFSPYDDNIDIPPGMGAVTITLSNVARTILPNTPDVTTFDYFNVYFTAAAPGDGVSKDFMNETLTTGKKFEPFILQPGTYNLIIWAYYGTSPSGTPVATVNLNGIVVAEGENTPKNIKLELLIGDGNTTNGTFSWNVSFSDVTVTSANMKILSNNLDVNLLETGKNTGTHDLQNGVYTVEFTLESSGKTIVWKEIAHIYGSLTTNCNLTFTASHFNNPIHTVTFNHNYGTTPGTETQSVLHGGTIATMPSLTRINDAYLYQNPAPAPANVGWEVEGWYNNAVAASGTKFTSTTPVHTSLTLYANWTGPIDVSASSGSNDVEKAITYVNTNPNAYTLFVASNTSIVPQNLNTANTNLTIQGTTAGSTALNLNGTGNMFTVGANTPTSSIALTLNNIIINGSVIIDQLAKFKVAGSVTIDEVTLTANAAYNSSIEYVSASSVDINQIHLRGLSASITGLNSVTSYWEDKSVLVNVTSSDVTALNNKLGNFMSVPTGTESISSTHSLELDDTDGVLKKTSQNIDFTFSMDDFVPDNSATGSGNFPPQTLTRGGNAVNITAPTGATNVSWELETFSLGTGNTLSFNPAEWNVDTYTLYCSFTLGGNTYLGKAEITITN